MLLLALLAMEIVRHRKARRGYFDKLALDEGEKIMAQNDEFLTVCNTWSVMTTTSSPGDLSLAPQPLQDGAQQRAEAAYPKRELIY